MPRAKRAKLASRRRSSVAAVAADPPRNTGWLSIRRREPSEQPRRAEDNGTSLANELILLIFATFLEIADLVCCAATCRRWRRLVSSEAAFICSAVQRPGPGGKFIPPLAVGFFHYRGTAAAAAAIRFVPLASALRRFPALREPSPSLRTLAGGELLDSSGIVASRNGLLVLDPRRSKPCRALKLYVCNPMTGAVHALPTIGAKDYVGHHACTVLTADDFQVPNGDTASPRLTGSHYRVLMVYRRRDFTAFRSYSSQDGCWGPERRVTGAQLGRTQVRRLARRGGVVASGGRSVYWIVGDGVFGLRLDTAEATSTSLPASGRGEDFSMQNAALGMTPEGRLCAVQLSSDSLTRWSRGKCLQVFKIRVLSYGGGHGGADDEGILHQDHGLWTQRFEMNQPFPGDPLTTDIKLQWFCEKSGFVFITGSEHHIGRSDVYTLSLSTRQVHKVASNSGEGYLSDNLYGYEMDQTAYLTSLAEPEEEEV